MNTIIQLSLALTVFGGPTDWVNPEYAMWSASNSAGPNSPTYDSQNSIIAAAQNSAKSGPWSVTYTATYPPSNDTRDYLSWAPYHWPNCNWCNEDNSRGMYSDPSSNGSPDTPNDSGTGGEFFRQPRRLKRVHRRRDLVYAIITARSDSAHQVLYPTAIPGADAVQSALASLDDPATTASPNTDPPTGDSYEKTSVGKPSATRTAKSSCTPSPTSHMAPSATWTTCPYVARDGMVNPDVRSLRPPGEFNSVSEAAIYNAIAYVLTGSTGYSQNVATFIDTFFLDNETGMKPNMDFGQVIRGPGRSGQSGTFAGILDARGMTKVVNSILIVRRAKSPDWSNAKDSRMMNWARDYVSWLANSPSGKGAASRPNNHATFYTLQLASIQVLAGDYDGARGTVNKFVTNIFQDQIAHSGEQPFEAVRTRPFHYRCFNLEALIALAKLGEMLNLNLWTIQSKYGATIQDAVDYTMTVNPGKENSLELGPHVAAIAAAYGDPNGKYAAFLAKTDTGYKSKPYWFFDQTKAIRGSGSKGGEKVWTIESTLEDIGFECPMVFREVSSTELDNGIFVTCDELRPFYLY